MKNFSLCLIITLTAVSFGVSQDDEKVEPRVDISYYHDDNQLPYVIVKVRKRLNRRFFPIVGVPVKTYFNEEYDSLLLSTAKTNEKGEVKVFLPESLQAVWEASEYFDFITNVDESDSLEQVSESISIFAARLKISGLETEDGRLVKGIVERMEGGEWVSVADVDVKIFVKRSLGRIFISDDFFTSDEDGMLLAPFDLENIPGDVTGKITIGGIIEDHEEFGTLSAYTEQLWGKVFHDDNSSFEIRTLWSPRNKTPIWLLVFPNLIILGVWGTIIYLLKQIVKLKKLSKQNH